MYYQNGTDTLTGVMVVVQMRAVPPPNPYRCKTLQAPHREAPATMEIVERAVFKRTNSVEAVTSQAVLLVQMVCNVPFSMSVSCLPSSLAHTHTYKSLSRRVVGL